MKSAAFLETISASEPELRDRALASLIRGCAPGDLEEACDALEAFRQEAGNLYERVRASLFLHAIYRFAMMDQPAWSDLGRLPAAPCEALLDRRFREALTGFIATRRETGPDSNLFSALAETYHHLAFEDLADQVRRSVRATRGNQWMFRVGHPSEHPLRVRRELFERGEGNLLYPILIERTPVRLDLSHSGWSDIFFLGMDCPEGARVLNISVDLGVRGRDGGTRPPVEVYVRVLPEPVLRLTSIDLRATKDVTDIRELFNFGNDYLGLLKAGVIASGVVPPSFEGAAYSLAEILGCVVEPGMGLELVTKVNDIPKGSRLAVSTNLLAGIVSALARATGQSASVEGPLDEPARRLIAARAILGEWLGGSGGGWQDSGGVWPGFKIIEGVEAREGDPEYGVSRGRLLPTHRLFGPGDLHPEITTRIADSLILLHGGMAQNVGPILEMVTERYLLRSEPAWRARHDMAGIFDGIVESLRAGDVRALAGWTTKNWEGPLKTIIPWVTNRFTETIIARARERLGDRFWGFQMLGGMSGGGMGMYVAPEARETFPEQILEIMKTTKAELEDALPFAMEPVVYDFAVNERGTDAKLLRGEDALMPGAYYGLQAPNLTTLPVEDVPYARRAEIDHFASRLESPGEARAMLRTLVSTLFRVSEPVSRRDRAAWDKEAERIKAENGFDLPAHEQVRDDLRAGRIGLASNRLPVETAIADVEEGDAAELDGDERLRSRGREALRKGQAAPFTMAAGMGSRWTSGAGVVKAVNPFVHMAGAHRSFLEIHLAKTRRHAQEYGVTPPHLVSTSFLTQGPVVKHLGLAGNCGYEGEVVLSPGRSIGQRLVPMVRDLRYLWEETPQETLDEQKQKVRDASRAALMDWARTSGEGSDYTDNVPLQRFNPPGHWYEVPNLLRNGVLADVLERHPGLQVLMLHNVDTLGADLDPEALGRHLASGAVLTFEVIPRRIWDRGGGLARVNGRVRLLEGLAQPHEDDELRLRYYSSNTTWVSIDPLLELFGLTREDLRGPAEAVDEAVRRFAQRLPTYVTLKDVKRRWGHGQEDVYPVAQFEKLWTDMTGLPDCPCRFLAVPRRRGQQLKDPSELDAWAQDGSMDYIETLCRFD